MDSLVLLTVDEWPKLRDSFRNYKPYGIVGYNLLDTQIKMKNMGLDCIFEVYCPFGDVANGMVAKLTKAKIHQLIILANSDDTSKLEEALLSTNLIDWPQQESQSTVEIPFVEPGTRRCLDRVLPKLGLQLNYEAPTDVYVFNRNRRPYQNVKVPEGTYVAAVRPEHIEQVDRVWPHRYDSSDWLFSQLIKSGQSYGLYLSSDDSLVAWMFINEAGFLSHLYCEEQHRKKGYAEFMVKYVTNAEVQRGKDVYCYVLDGNVNSLKLFSKLGYEKIGKSSWTLYESIKP